LSIRRKTLSLIGTVLIVFMAVSTTISYYVVTHRFAGLEQKFMETHLLRIRNELSDRLANLEALCADWGPWDDTYQFINDLNTDYINDNLIDETFSNFRLNFMLFFDSEGRPVYSRFF
jgi:sensor domain CHASE-containing protein